MRAAAVVAAAVVATVTACSGEGTDRSRDEDGALSGTVTVLAAASLTESFTALGEELEQQHPDLDVQFSFAASSELATQVTQGAPADVFASASTATMRQATRVGSAAGRPRVFARNRLQIVVPAGNPQDVATLADLGREELVVALCAREVPCGAAADVAFDAAGVTPAPDTYEADVKATLNKVRLGEVDAALVYRTDVLAAGDDVVGVDFAESAVAVNDYPLVRLRDAPNPAGARAFVALVLSDVGRAALADAGFDVP